MKLFITLSERSLSLAGYVDMLYLDAHITEQHLSNEDRRRLVGADMYEFTPDGQPQNFIDHWVIL
jgi:hypothetical protein